MEYYAKSNETKKESKNVNDIRSILNYLLDNQMDKLNENESKMIISYLDSLEQQTVQEKKTLRGNRVIWCRVTLILQKQELEIALKTIKNT